MVRPYHFPLQLFSKTLKHSSKTAVSPTILEQSQRASLHFFTSSHVLVATSSNRSRSLFVPLLSHRLILLFPIRSPLSAVLVVTFLQYYLIPPLSRDTLTSTYRRVRIPLLRRNFCAGSNILPDYAIHPLLYHSLSPRAKEGPLQPICFYPIFSVIQCYQKKLLCDDHSKTVILGKVSGENHSPRQDLILYLPSLLHWSSTQLYTIQSFFVYRTTHTSS